MTIHHIGLFAVTFSFIVSIAACRKAVDDADVMNPVQPEIDGPEVEIVVSPPDFGEKRITRISFFQNTDKNLNYLDGSAVEISEELVLVHPKRELYLAIYPANLDKEILHAAIENAKKIASIAKKHEVINLYGNKIYVQLNLGKR